MRRVLRTLARVQGEERVSNRAAVVIGIIIFITVLYLYAELMKDILR